MLIGAIVISAASGMYGILKYKNLYNPFFLQSVVWGVTIGGYFLRKDNYYSISLSTEICIFLGVLFLNIGMMLGGHLRIKKTYELKRRDIITGNILILIITFISIIVSLPRSFHFILLLFSGFKWNYIRYSLMAVYIMDMPRILKILYTYISLPASFLSANCFSYEITHNLKKQMWLHLLNIVAVFFSDGGRTVIMELTICFFVNFAISQKSSNSSNFIRKHGKLLIITFIIFFIGLTYIRFNDITETIENTIDNLSCSIVNFDIQNKNIDGFTYGFLSFQGIALLIRGLKATPYAQLALQCYEAINEATQVGPKIIYNSYVTIFYCFYRDFGYIGVCLLSALTGGLTGYYFKRVLLRTKDVKYLFEYIFFANLILQSYSTFLFAHIKYTIYFIVLILVNEIIIKSNIYGLCFRKE